MSHVTAVVVTYNRKELLEECLHAILQQTTPVSHLLVVNNHSTDGTEELFQSTGPFFDDIIELVTLPENIGGAGGFHEAFRRSVFTETDFIWLMDDDTIPQPDTLEALLESYDELKQEGVTNTSFLASSVFGPQGEPMNVPVLQTKPADNGYGDWYRHLDKGLISIKSATFVSLLIPTKAVKEVGLPEKDYFIWGDDTEYTQRLVTLYGPAFLCGNSKVCHKRVNTKKISILEEDNPNRIDLYRYFFRNSLWNAKKYNGKLNTLGHLAQYELIAVTALLRQPNSLGVQKFQTVQKGILEFIKTIL